MFAVACSDNTSNNKETTASGSKEKVELTVSAAASLNNALTEIKSNYETEHPEVKINYNFGSSGSLQQQILQGAPVDLFFSSAKDKFDILVENGFIVEEEGVNLVRNELVLIVPIDANAHITGFEDLTKGDIKKMSIGTPESVPAGKYAKEALEELNVWTKVETKIVYGKDVRQVLSYVETGNVDAGIVYKTDALASDQVNIVATADRDTHTPIVYPLGIMKETKHPEETKTFYTYLQSDEALHVLRDYGFTSN